ncbi:MAG: BamA/TamA family outer membrane protein [Bacteroidales bacterium]|nr:BamA/TamA family outer membrane protein [Bacteroidales bacterium]
MSNFHWFLILFSIVLLKSSTIFAQDSDSILIESIEIEGNKKTKAIVILREIPFQQGEYTDKQNLEIIKEEIHNNLKNTGLFNYVVVNFIEKTNNLSVKIILEERWYFWPYPILEHSDRNINAWLSDSPLEMINYGVFFTQYNFRGRDEILRFKVRLGYKEQFAAEYSSPAIDKNRDLGITIKAAYFRQHKTPVLTIDNKLVYLENKDAFIKTYSDFEAGIVYRPGLYLKNYFTIGYNSMKISEEILQLNPLYSVDSNASTNFFKFRYTFTWDKRDYIYFPTKGYQFRLRAENKFFTTNSSNKYLLETITEIKLFSTISNKFFAANGISVKKSLDKSQPYFLKEGFGFEYNLRGYEYYVIDGNNFVLNSNSLYFNILPMKIREFSIIPFEKFKKIHYSLYTNIFFDAGMVFDKYALDKTMLNEFLFSFGAGFNLVTYYDRVFRIDFSVNKKMEPGLFIHFASPI